MYKNSTKDSSLASHLLSLNLLILLLRRRETG